MVGTPAAADAIDPRNCPRCDHSFGIVLAGAYRLTEHFRGTDSPVWMEPVQSVETVTTVPAGLILRIPHEPGETVDAGPAYGYSGGTGDGAGLPALTETLSPAERHELDAFLADAFADRAIMCAEVYDAEAIGETRDDGALYHGRVPSEDEPFQSFSPYYVAQSPILPPCEADLPEIPAWAYATAGVA